MPTKSINEIFIDNLIKYLDLAGMNYSELADALNLNRSTVSMWISKKSLPRMEVLDKIADILHIQSADLITDKTMEKSKPGVYIVTDEEPQTVAAHFDGDDFTEEELKEIQQFAAFVKSKRSNNLVVEGSTLRSICDEIAGIKPPDVDNGPSVVEDAITKAKKDMSKKTTKIK